jgi:pyruvate kinase
MWHPGAEPALEGLAAEVRALRDALLGAERAHAEVIGATHPTHRRSAANLVHYVELRRHDIRHLQAQLTALGLSSLGRSEADVLPAVDAVLHVLTRLAGHPPPATGPDTEPDTSSVTERATGADRLRANTDRLLGPASPDRDTRIMVTLPGSAADDRDLVGHMVDAGMDLARINCAHDDADHWARMAGAVQAHPRPDGHRCQVAMDLAGPKLRTGPLQPGPRVVKVGPRRDPGGQVLERARIWLSATGSAAPPDVTPERPAVPVPVDDADWIGRRRAGDRITLRDARGAVRRWDVVAVSPDGCLATTGRTTYVATGGELRARTARPGDIDGDGDPVRVGELPERPLAHRVREGDRVILTRDLTPAEPTPPGRPHRIGCTLPEAFASTRVGQRVWLDEGRFGGVITGTGADQIEIEIDAAPPGGGNLKGAKGINLPETDLDLAVPTRKDLDDLDVVARHADVVALSFVRRPADVARLQEELHRRGGDQLGLLVKIENAAAFTNLPGLLLTALRSPSVGVMIARGDLAVEVGFERLAEVQEEILWICEAAHVPVVWATQVLDTLARTGRRTRAEITDAAMAHRAECVMLNKGPHVTDAIEVLDDVLGRMQRHHHKKRSLLSRLRAWDDPEGAAAGQAAGSGRP